VAKGSCAGTCMTVSASSVFCKCIRIRHLPLGDLVIISALWIYHEWYEHHHYLAASSCGEGWTWRGIQVRSITGYVWYWIVSVRRRRIFGRDFPYSMKLSLPTSNVDSIQFPDTLVEFNRAKSAFYRHFFPKTYDSYSRIPSKMLFAVPTFLNFPNHQSYITPSTSNSPPKARWPKPHFPTLISNLSTGNYLEPCGVLLRSVTRNWGARSS